jgi:dTDP-4-dehydrorhamnose 3,5-epimerase
MHSQPKGVTFSDGDIHDVLVYELMKIHDDRGWLAEIFRQDWLPAEFHPRMSYVSMTAPGVERGPHEHIEQADLFCFIGPSDFKLVMWDPRPTSPTAGMRMTLFAGQSEPKAIIVPSGVVHAYRNVGNDAGIVINCPNRLYKGEGKTDEVDEIRHEDDPGTIFKIP